MNMDEMNILTRRLNAVARALGVEEGKTLLPVLRVPGVCDVEVSAEEVMVLTRMRRDRLLKYDFSRLEGRNFEAYGLNDLEKDLILPGESAEELKKRVQRMDGEEICFSFFPADHELPAFVDLLRKEGFFCRSESESEPVSTMVKA